MWQWFTYNDYGEEDAAFEKGSSTPRFTTRAGGGGGGGGGGSDSGDSNGDMGPIYEKLDPAATAAILTQAAFRGYRLRERLRRLPAREAEKQIKALHNNARGFRRVGLFLTYAGLYFTLVFYSIDVAFQQSVQHTLRDHLALAKYGPDNDKTYHDVSSLADVHEWMQSFYLQTYDGTQMEHPCMACAIKPPDDVCDACDLDPYEAAFNDTGSSTAEAAAVNSETIASRVRRTLVSSTSTSSSAISSASTTTSSRFGLSEECGSCLIGRLCTGVYLERCEAALGFSSSTTTTSSSSVASASSSSIGAGSASDSSTQQSSPSSSPSSSASNFTALLDALDLEPEGGVRASGGYVAVQNASQCYLDYFDANVGGTSGLSRFALGLEVPYSGNGFVANRNRIVGGMLVSFNRRKRSLGDECSASRDYYDVCMADDDSLNKTTIFPDDPWPNFRPSPEVEYSEVASAYPLLVDTGGFDVGLNFGYCTLLLAERLDVIPKDEVRSVTVQLVTYNGNKQSAYGSIKINFDFTLGGEIVTSELVTAYTLNRNLGQGDDGSRWLLGSIFVIMTFGMMWHDTKKWLRARRLKAKRNPCRCCFGFTFFFLVLMNILMWVGWAALGAEVEVGSLLVSNNDGVLDSLTEQLVDLQGAADYSSAYQLVFLCTTMAGLYRWLFEMLTFHKRMSIVTDTLSGASTHLYHFLFVFFLVILVSSALTWLLVGSSVAEFSTLELAWDSVIRVSLGESENFYPQILEAQPYLGPVVIVLYQVLGIVLLLNVVIAILLEAYRGVVGGMRGEDTIFQSLIAFIGMTMCSLVVRIRWASAWVRWRFARWTFGNSRDRGTRPSLKTFLQGSTGVYGVDGRPVVMVRRPPEKAAMTDRQLSFNCPRYITVSEMQALIEATPVPAVVADRLVRKIVHDWIFRSDEPLTSDALRWSWSRGYSNATAASMKGSGFSSGSSLPLLRQTSSGSSR